jgi:hypothetical protein
MSEFLSATSRKNTQFGPENWQVEYDIVKFSVTSTLLSNVPTVLLTLFAA